MDIPVHLKAKLIREPLQLLSAESIVRTFEEIGRWTYNLKLQKQIQKWLGDKYFQVAETNTKVGGG